MTGIRVAIPLTALAILLTGCGSSANKPPPGVTAHQSLAAKGGLASQPSGTCHLLSANLLATTMGGTSSAPVPDTLTPGLDRCTWTITNSHLGTSLQLIAYRTNAPTNTATTGLTTVPQLGAGATWAAHSNTLVMPYENGALGLQAVPSGKTKIDPKAALQTLISLGQQLN